MKIWAVIRWIAVMIILGVVSVTAPVIYPIAYVLERITKKKILWIYHDSEDADGCSANVNWFNKGKCNFWVKYKWCLRNPAWNLHLLFKPKQGLKKRISSKGWLEKNGNSDISIFTFAVLKYVDKNGIYQDNKGKYVSKKHSVFGRMLVFYKVGRTVYFRWSKVGRILGLWYELQAGTNDRRYLFRLKFNNKKIWSEGVAL